MPVRKSKQANSKASFFEFHLCGLSPGGVARFHNLIKKIPHRSVFGRVLLLSRDVITMATLTEENISLGLA